MILEKPPFVGPRLKVYYLTFSPTTAWTETRLETAHPNAYALVVAPDMDRGLDLVRGILGSDEGVQIAPGLFESHHPRGVCAVFTRNPDGDPFLLEVVKFGAGES